MKKEKHLFKDKFRTYNHGDYQFKNILIKNNKLSGILDFDSFRIGDPSSDLHMFLQNCIDEKIQDFYIHSFFEGYQKISNLPIYFFEKSAFYRYYRAIQEVISIPFQSRYLKKEEVELYKDKIKIFLNKIIEGEDLCLDLKRSIYET